MAFHVRDPETDRVVRELAAVRGETITEAIRRACEQALAQASEPARRDARIARVRAIKERIASHPKTGLAADKAFFDSLNDE